MQRPLWLTWAALVVTFTPAGADAAEAFPCQQLTGFWIRSAWPEEEGGVIPRAGDTFTVTVQADPSVEPTELVPGSPRYHQDGAGAHLRLTLNDSGSGKTRDFAADVYDLSYNGTFEFFGWGAFIAEQDLCISFTVSCNGGPTTLTEFLELESLGAECVTSADLLPMDLEQAAHGALTGVAPCGANPPVETRTLPVNQANLEPTWRGGVSPATCSIPCRVYLHSGEEHFERTDLVIPGRGDIHFAMKRSYRSRLEYDGPLGHGWDFTYNEGLYPQENGDVVRSSGNGRTDTWILQPDGSYRSPPGFFRTLIQEPDGSFVTRSPEGFQRLYAADGRLTAYVDRNGNTMSCEYDDAGNLARVVDAFGCAAGFRFESSAEGVDRLAAIHDFSGREVVYSYDERGDLTSVRTPVVDGTSTGNDFPLGRAESYTYSSGFDEAALNHNLLSVTFPQEVADDGPPGLTWIYGEDSADAVNFDHVVRLSIGGGRVNASGVPAGGDFVLEYEMLNTEVGAGDPTIPRGRARVTEPNGNVREYFVNELDQHIITRHLARGLRGDEPEFYEKNVRSSTPKDSSCDGSFPPGTRCVSRTTRALALPNRVSSGSVVSPIQNAAVVRIL